MFQFITPLAGQRFRFGLLETQMMCNAANLVVQEYWSFECNSNSNAGASNIIRDVTNENMRSAASPSEWQY